MRDDPARLVNDPAKELKSFTVAQMHPLGAKRGVGRGAFIDSVLDGVTTSYKVIGQQLKSRTAAPFAATSRAERTHRIRAARAPRTAGP